MIYLQQQTLFELHSWLNRRDGAAKKIYFYTNVHKNMTDACAAVKDGEAWLA